MIRLLKLEWLKYGKSTTLWVIMGIFALLTSARFNPDLKMKETASSLLDPSDLSQFPLIWDFQAYNGSWLTFFLLGFLSLYLVTTEFAQRTAKQNIIQGLSRSSFFLAKVLDITVIAAVSTLIFGLVTIGLGMRNTPGWTWSMVWDNDLMLLRYFVMSLGYMTFALLCAFLIRRTGPALILYISYSLFIELILRYQIHDNIFGGNSQYYYPLNAMEDLAPLPIYKLAPGMLDEEQLGLTVLSPGIALVTSVIYILLFLALSYFSFSKRDL